MGRAIFISKKGGFFRKNDRMIDMALAHMAQDIEINVKNGGLTPVKSGRMKASTKHRKVMQGHYQVTVGDANEIVYARVQERGRRLTGPGAPTREFTNYTTAGTGKGWFKTAVNQVVDKKTMYIKEASKLAGF